MARTEIAGFRVSSYKTLQATVRKTANSSHKIKHFQLVQAELIIEEAWKLYTKISCNYNYLVIKKRLAQLLVPDTPKFFFGISLPGQVRPETDRGQLTYAT